MSSRYLPLIAKLVITQGVVRNTRTTALVVHNQLHISHTMSTSREPRKTLTLDTLNPCIKVMEYAVRGPLPIRAAEIEKELQQGDKKPFNEVIRTNMGDCHAMGQTPITFIRQLLVLVSYPELINELNFPTDVKERAKLLLGECKGKSVGSYTDSVGIEIIRRHAAEFIAKRDGFPSDWQNVILSAGAAAGIRAVLKLLICDICGQKPGVMVPIPQYPMYSAVLSEYDMHQVGYYLDESKGWGLTTEELKRAVTEAKSVCKPRAIVVINPGNPTGQVLTKQNIQEVIKFAYDEELFLIADEVYQHNIYGENCEFHSFKKVMSEMGEPYCHMEIASFMSCSKGYMGECGLRSGFAEIINLDPSVRLMYLKSVSATVCPNVLGQVAIDCVVKPPEPGEPSYDLYEKEKAEVLTSLAKRAKLVTDTYNSIQGISCNTVQGAMYAFPQIKLPPKAIQEAARRKQAADVYYSFQLLEKAGICVVPGSGFGQKDGTYHFRTTILPQTEKLKEMLENFKKFHEDFIKQHQ